jgi:hypothetical protein
VLDPDDGDPFPARLLDQAADVGDDRVTLVSPPDNAVLHVDDEERGVRPVLQCGHGLPLLAWLPCLPTVTAATDSAGGGSLHRDGRRDPQTQRPLAALGWPAALFRCSGTVVTAVPDREGAGITPCDGL